MSDDTKVKKPRKRPRWGVLPAAIAYCQCGWYSGPSIGKGAFANAHGELWWHRRKCPQGEFDRIKGK